MGISKSKYTFFWRNCFALKTAVAEFCLTIIKSGLLYVCSPFQLADIEYARGTWKISWYKGWQRTLIMTFVCLSPFELANVIEYAGGTFIATRKKFSSQPTNNWRWGTLQLSFISLFSGCWKTDENLVGQLLVILQIGCEHLSNRFPLIPGLFFFTIYQVCTLFLGCWKTDELSN